MPSTNPNSPSNFNSSPSMNTPLDSQQTILYTNGVGQGNEYEVNPGVCILPLAEDPPTDPEELKAWSPVVILRLHAPYRVRRYRTTTVKQNNPPVIPAPIDVGAFVLVQGNILISCAANNTNANFDWQVITDYIYVENCVSRNQDGFVLGASPWVWTPSAENAAAVGQAPPIPSYGAIAQAGLEPLVGSYMSDRINFNSNYGWGYNVPSFFPGVFLNDNLANGGGRTPTDGSVAS